MEKTKEETQELDMDQAIRYFQYTAIDTPEDAETVRDEAVEVITQLRDLLFELSSLEIDLVDGLLDHYKVKL